MDSIWQEEQLLTILIMSYKFLRAGPVGDAFFLS